MTDKQKGIAAIAGVAAFLILLLSIPGKQVQEAAFGHGDSYQAVDQNLIGAPSASTTLTSVYTGTVSPNMTVRGLPHLVFSGSYRPKSHGSALYLLIERSVDNGATYQPYSVLAPGTTQVLVYSAGASSTLGIPFLIPAAGTGSAASGTDIGFTFDLTMAADRFRVRAKESTTSTYGVLVLQVQASTN